MLERVVTTTGAIVGAILFSFLLSYPAMILWNTCLVPAIPGLQHTDWLQMWGISLLLKSFSKS